MTVTVRPGIVGPGEPGHRVFEGNFVVECTCGATIQICGTEGSANETALQHVRSNAWRYTGGGPLFDKDELICHAHEGFQVDYHPLNWVRATDDGTCFICAEDRQIGPH